MTTEQQLDTPAAQGADKVSGQGPDAAAATLNAAINKENMFAKARHDLLIAAVVAAVVMIGAALFAPARHLWGVVLGTMLALANLSALGRLGVQFLSAEGEGVALGAGIKTILKVLGLMGIVVAVLVTRPEYALGLSVGLALPAVAGLLLLLRAPEWRSLIGLKLGFGTGPKMRK